MKLSVSVPDDMGYEIKNLSKTSDRQVSWLIQKAWLMARRQLQASSSQDKRRFNLKRCSLSGRFDDKDVRKAAYE